MAPWRGRVKMFSRAAAGYARQLKVPFHVTAIDQFESRAWGCPKIRDLSNFSWISLYIEHLLYTCLLSDKKSKKSLNRRCQVPSCSTVSLQQRGFYKIPEHPVRRQAWIDSTKLPNDCSTSARICWKHFKYGDFMKEITPKDIAECTFGQLKKNVIPSEFMPTEIW